jgi:hypothetical protein
VECTAENGGQRWTVRLGAMSDEPGLVKLVTRSGDVLDGPYRRWADGRLVILGQYAAGERDGAWLYFDPLGRIDALHTWHRGVRDGVTSCRNTTEVWSNGALVSTVSGDWKVDTDGDGRPYLLEADGCFLVHYADTDLFRVDVRRGTPMMLRFMEGRPVVGERSACAPMLWGMTEQGRVEGG